MHRRTKVRQTDTAHASQRNLQGRTRLQGRQLLHNSQHQIVMLAPSSPLDAGNIDLPIFSNRQRSPAFLFLGHKSEPSSAKYDSITRIILQQYFSTTLRFDIISLLYVYAIFNFRWLCVVRSQHRGTQYSHLFLVAAVCSTPACTETSQHDQGCFVAGVVQGSHTGTGSCGTPQENRSCPCSHSTAHLRITE